MKLGRDTHVHLKKTVYTWASNSYLNRWNQAVRQHWLFLFWVSFLTLRPCPWVWSLTSKTLVSEEMPAPHDHMTFSFGRRISDNWKAVETPVWDPPSIITSRAPRQTLAFAFVANLAKTETADLGHQPWNCPMGQWLPVGLSNMNS